MSKLIIGENDLKTLMPELMEDWDLNEKKSINLNVRIKLLCPLEMSYLWS